MKRLKIIISIAVISFIVAACTAEHGPSKTGCPGHGGYGQTLTIEQTQNQA